MTLSDPEMPQPFLLKAHLISDDWWQT